MVRIARSLIGGLLALSMLLPASVAAQKATTTITKAVAPTTTAPVVAATSHAAPTTNFVLPTTTPTAPGTTSPNGASNQTSASCPGPLIPNTKGLKISTCMGPCCIKCPAIESFYKPNQVENVLKAAYITRQVSMGFAVFIAISYLVLPGKRSQPHISVLFLTVSLSLWYAAFDVMPGVSNACVDDFEQSTGHNSRLCGVQGVLIIYLTQTSALWCSLLIYKLHMLAVWRSNWIDAYYGWFTGLCWILPLAFAIPVAVKNLAEYPGIGFSCLVNTSNLNTYLFYPTAVYIYPAMLCHIVTVAKMIHLAVMSSKIDTGLSQLSSDARMRITTTMQAKRLLRGQWRPALMMGTVMTSLTVFWLFYFVDAHRIASLGPSTPWLQEWVACVMANGAQGKSSVETQTICAKGAVHNLPSIPWFTAAEMLVAVLGVIVAAVFISKSEFWEEWAYLLSNLLRRGKTGRGSSRGRSSPDGGSSAPTRTFNNQHLDDRKVAPLRPDMKGSAPGVYRSNSKASLNGSPASQWYDMDDLIDKEYDDQGNRRLQRSMSYGSRAGIAVHSGPNPVSDPPHYNNTDTISGDLLYRPPIQEATPTHWSPSAHTLASPTRAYMNQSDHERYVEEPVVPSPVPRTPKVANSEPVFLSSPVGVASSPTSATGYHSNSLSPMPPRSPTYPQRSQPLESVPIIGVATRGSPALAYQQPQVQAQYPHQKMYSTSPSQKQKEALYSSNESEQIMMASRGSVTMGKNMGPSTKNNGSPQPHPMRINTTLAQSSQIDERSKSPPPSVPVKSPHRHLQQGYTSPPIRTPASPSSNHYRE
ncbi:hypothetical protein BC939DRAFT_444107 [Gamsiella multidivaricata]|uniref:uncharacterized protein n=1 Tax=Gamsiella multidivaricata TaxID=101098 RepID=UPI00221FDB4D|nr:uncharacterized protein BC939DRAFT_444107 [Gamsiella multidivaricata]KAG0365114.1 hypothetical protein BGZ54_006852 [Gamsiella multidivaricata]KAI7827939.1 hypothetical protein BC939DRAFT_444107 [Gamsiella multidivaricata]